MLEAEIRITNSLGLHARAAAKLVKVANKFCSRVLLTNKEKTREANAKSILSLLAMAASKDTVLLVSTDGEDEKEALDAVVSLIENRFGED